MLQDDDVPAGFRDADIETAERTQLAAANEAARRWIRRARERVAEAEALGDGDPRKAERVAIAGGVLRDALANCPHTAMQGAEGWNREHPDARIPLGKAKCLDECGEVINDPTWR